MGIRPKDVGENLDVAPDTPQSRYGEVLGENQKTGEVVGGEVGKIESEAVSANTAVSEMSRSVADHENRIKTLEGKASPDLSALASKQYVDDLVTVTNSASGTGWRVTKVGRLVVVDITGATANFTIPIKFLPLGLTYVTVTGAAGTVGRVSINPTTGVCTINNITGAVYGNGSYFTT